MKVVSLLIVMVVFDLHAQQFPDVRGLPETRAPAVDIWSVDIPVLFTNPTVPDFFIPTGPQFFIGGPMVSHWTKESFRIADISVTRPGGGLSISAFPDQKSMAPY